MEEEKRVPSEAADELAGNMIQREEATAVEQQIQNAEQQAAAEIAKLKAELESAQTERDEFADRNLRLVAEMENLRRRTERDKAEFAKYAISEFARDVIGVGDNIRRAIEAVPKNAVEGDPALSTLIEGVEMTERDLIRALEKYQVKRFDPLGEQFNPHLHDAMTKVDVPNAPADTVVQVIHAGYMIDERVLRPAAVIVAKGGSGNEKPSGNNNNGNNNAQPSTTSETKIPVGAMKVPEDAISSDMELDRPRSQHVELDPNRPRPNAHPSGPDMERARIHPSDAPRKARPDVKQTVLGRDLSGGGRGPAEPRSRGQVNGYSGDERVAQFRKRVAGANPAPAPEPDQRPQSQAAPAANKPSALHKPVISKPE